MPVNVMPVDYQLEAQQLARRRALADALQKHSMEPIQSGPSGRLIAPISPFQGFARLGEALAAKGMENDVSTKEKELSDRYKSEGETAFNEAMQQTGNPLLAAAILSKSPNPVHQQLGQQMYLKYMEPADKWETAPGPRGSLVQKNSRTGETKQVVGPEAEKLSDWQKPGWVEAQRAAAEAKGEGRMSPTAQKEIFEADETAQASKNVMTLLSEAQKINDTAYSGPMAKERATVMSWLPGENKGADATINLDNIMTGQALESLKSIFGGMPTEGERKILLDMQASPSKTPKQRKDIIERAMAAAQRRLEFNSKKAESLRSGTYFRPGQSPAGETYTPTEIPGLPQNPALSGNGKIKFLGIE